MLNEYLNKIVMSLPKGFRINAIRVNTEGFELLHTFKVDKKEQNNDNLGYIAKYDTIPVIIDNKQEVLLSVEYIKCE